MYQHFTIAPNTEMMPDRSIAPLTQKVDFLMKDTHRLLELPNGITVYLVHGGSQELVRIELVYKAGSFYQGAKSVATATNALLPNGTPSLTARAIAERFEYFGAHVETNTEKDNAYVSLYTLNTHLHETLPLLAEVIHEADFPQDELEIYRKTKSHTLSVNLQKVKYLARVHFNEQLFGSRHPYGMRLRNENIDQLESGQLKAFHRRYYQQGRCMIFVSGSIPHKLEEILARNFGTNSAGSFHKPLQEPTFEIEPGQNRKLFISKPDASQSALRIGFRTINREHAEYPELFILHTVLGGYFGSRLMSNIREKKGYTYGIGSVLASLKKSGVFVISSEVGGNVRRKAVREIYKEVKMLRDEPISEEELSLVKNYLTGALLRGMEGPFMQAERLRSAIEYGQTMSYYDQYARTIQDITSGRLQELANKYFDQGAFFETVAGV